MAAQRQRKRLNLERIIKKKSGKLVRCDNKLIHYYLLMKLIDQINKNLTVFRGIFKLKKSKILLHLSLHNF